MLLITETTEDVTYLKEANEAGEKSYFLEGIVMQSAIKNRNGRVYPEKILMREMERYKDNFVSKNRAFGELNHPQSPTINLDRVSHMFVELRQDGSNVIGKAKIMDTPMGKIVKNYIDEKAVLGMSTRGLGSLKKRSDGIMEVQDDFTLATAGDIVSDPSGPSCFVNGIMEGVNFYFDLASGTYKAANVMDEIEEEIKQTAKVSKKALEEKASKLFERFIRSL